VSLYEVMREMADDREARSRTVPARSRPTPLTAADRGEGVFR
jgi:hypothetical protein